MSTVTDPAITAADLRNSALIMAHLGHTRGAIVARTHAAVCLDGAITLATMHQLVHVTDHPAPHWTTRSVPSYSYDLLQRRNAALDALVLLVPDRCNGCCKNGRRKGFYPCAIGDPLRGHARVHHYNDFECTGGEDALALLIEAAEKVEAGL